MFNFLTVDVEDWAQSTLNQNNPISRYVVDNTYRLLDVFDSHNVKGTFFILGLVAEKYPDLVNRIASRGHEIASHGYSHIPIFKLTPKEFKKEIKRSIILLENITGLSVIGYRAPDFSITKESIWALDILEECGIKYDSSIFPIKGKRYGIADAKRFVHKINNKNLLEVPMSTYRVFGRNIPACGGGYLRLYKLKTTKIIFDKINKLEQPGVLYVHPYELNVEELNKLKHIYKIPIKSYITQSINRSKISYRLKKLISSYEFNRIDNGLKRLGFNI